MEIRNLLFKVLGVYLFYDQKKQYLFGFIDSYFGNVLKRSIILSLVSSILIFELDSL